MNAGIPVAVVSGYLGAGKTTLINHVLREARGVRIAVLVNDFGALPIDAELIVSRSGDVIHIAGGCICCAFGSDLAGALVDIARRTPAPHLVIVETSGVSLPRPVAQSVALIGALALRRVIVLADALNIRTQSADAFIGDTIRDQLAQADVVVVNKLDAATTDQTAALRPWIAATAPHARVIETWQGAVPVDVLAGESHTLDRAFADRAVEHAADARYESMTLSAVAPIDAATFARALADPQFGVLRAKGLLRDQAGELQVLHHVNGASTVTRHDVMAARALGVVCIGLRGRLDRAGIASAFEAAQAVSSCQAR